MEPAGSFTAVVTDIRLESRNQGVARWQIALDTTLFTAASPAGMLLAVAPSGARLEVPVLGIVEERGVVWHVVDKPLTEGTEITGRIGRGL
jgi:alanyl-tRNA synthetase